MDMLDTVFKFGKVLELSLSLEEMVRLESLFCENQLHLLKYYFRR